MQLSQVYIMLQSLSHLGTLPSVMCSVSHPPARLEVLLASLWRQGWRIGGTSWVLSDTLLYELFQGFIQADLKNKISQAFPQCFAISRAFQTLTSAMSRSPLSFPALMSSQPRSGQFPAWQWDLFWNGSLFPALTHHTPCSGYLYRAILWCQLSLSGWDEPRAFCFFL